MYNSLLYDDVKEYVNNLGYELISVKYIRNQDPLIIKDKIGYYYFVSYTNLKISNKLRIVSKSNPYTIQNIKLWCKLNNKPFELLSEEYKEPNMKLKWKCLKNECGEIFEAIWTNIQSNKGCPYCAGQKVGLSNCLANLRPDLTLEWHPTKNGDLTPYDVTCGSKKYVWWKCDNNHEWITTVKDRNKSLNGCPYCAHILPCVDYNLLICNPELCKEWDYKKNNKNPQDYLPYSKQKVWWICKECGFKWKSAIGHRSNGIGCPQCSESKGEKRIKVYLNLNNIFYIGQKEFDGLIGTGNGLLSYDFYLPQHNLLIEYQGEQHEHYCKGFHKSKKDFEKQLEHDRRKRVFTHNNNINFLVIWYFDFDNIETIINNYLKEKL